MATPYASGESISWFGFSGTDYIDTLLVGRKWGGAQGTGVDLTYSFGGADSVYRDGYGNGEPLTGFGSLTDTQKVAADNALQAFANVANITFTEVQDSATVAGDIRFARSDAPSTAWAYYPSSAPEGGDIWLSNRSIYDTATKGTYGYTTFLHEIGHTLGLQHPHENNADLSFDTTRFSMMSYRSYEGAPLTGYTQQFYATTPMLHDIAALQYTYGANMSYNTGDNTYSWAVGERILETLWDAGGNDTIDWSNQSSAAVINLNDGEWSELGPAYWTGVAYQAKTFAIAYNAVIENAKGGSGNDTLIGNEVDNVLTGGAGADTFVFANGGGDDTITDFQAGAGAGDVIDLSAFGFTSLSDVTAATTVVGGGIRIALDADDSLTLLGVQIGDLDADDFDFVGNGDEVLVGGTGDDLLDGGRGNDTLLGGDGNDILIGGVGDDLLRGQAGDDFLEGGAGADILSGGDGIDTASYATSQSRVAVNLNTGLAFDGDAEGDLLSGIEKLIGSAFNDSLTAADGTDTTLHGGDGQDILRGADGNDVLWGENGNDILFGSAGADIMDGGSGSDTARYSTSSAAVFVDLEQGTASGGDAEGDTLNDIESLYGSQFNDTLIGDSNRNYLIGSGGDDSLFGGGGDDYLNGGAGADILDGGAGNDSASYHSSQAGVWIDLSAGTGSGGDADGDTLNAIENIYGSYNYGNTLIGDTADNSLSGGRVNDTLSGGGGNDTLSGRGGDDVLEGGVATTF